MKIPPYTFSEEKIKQLQQYRDKQHDIRLKIRFTALLMLAKNIEVEIVAFIVEKCVKTVENWMWNYLTIGIDSLNSFNYKPKQPCLTPEQIEEVVKWVKETTPSKTKKIKVHIEKQFGVTYTVEGVRQLLHRQGLKFLRPKVIPGDPPSEEEQREFVEKYKSMKATSEAGTIFLFIDAMHLVHQNDPGYCWADPKDPPVLKTNSGRKRLNIIGGYNTSTHVLTHLTGEENCDAERVKKFLELVIETYYDVPKIVLFSDNAKYFKANMVNDWLQDHPNVHIESLPTYAPNLNLIERFWKFTKEKLVKNTYYEKYKTFRATVFRFLNHTEDYAEELKTLMVEKFEIIKVNGGGRKTEEVVLNS